MTDYSPGSPVAVVAEAIHWYGANPQAEASPAEVIVAALEDAGLIASQRAVEDGVCPVCKIEPPKSEHPDYITPIYVPGVRHDASNKDCPHVLRLSPERAARLKERLDALDDARFRAWANSHNVWIR